MRRPARGSPQRRDAGAAAVEFVLVLIPLIVLVFGIINYGVYLSQQLALNNGVREGTRLAVVAGNQNNQECRQVVTGIQQASGPGIAMDTSEVQVQVLRVNSATGGSPVDCTGGFVTSSSNTARVCAAPGDNSIRANAQYPTKFIVPIPFLPAPTITLTATAVYRCEFIN